MCEHEIIAIILGIICTVLTGCLVGMIIKYW